MDTARTQPDALGYLLGGVSLLTISVMPLLVTLVPEVQFVGKLIAVAYWLLGGLAIWWAMQRFQRTSERVAALAGVVVGWYVLLQILWLLESVFSFV